MNKLLAQIYESVLNGQKDETAALVENAIGAGIDPELILNSGMILAMTEVGSLFEQGEYFVPEMLIAARAMQAGLAILRPALLAAKVEPVGKVVIGTVKGDLHDIGKNLVAMMLEGAGFEIVDLGTNVSPEQFIEAIQEGVDVLGLSALLTTTMSSMESTIRAIEEAGVRDKVKIIVGGAPVTADFAKNIGADGFAPDASQAVKLATSLIS